MNDLISRAAAMEWLDFMIYFYDEKTSPVHHRVLVDVREGISEMDAVDAAPVVFARWTTERTWKHDGEWYCSACEYEPVVFMDSKFCPNCGAKMIGEE